MKWKLQLDCFRVKVEQVWQKDLLLVAALGRTVRRHLIDSTVTCWFTVRGPRNTDG